MLDELERLRQASIRDAKNKEAKALWNTLSELDELLKNATKKLKKNKTSNLC